MIYTTTYSKTITSNNQIWSADDSTQDMVTNGITTVYPDIKIIGSSNSTNLDEISPTPVLEAGFETISGWIYEEYDLGGQVSGGQHSTYATEGIYSYGILNTQTSGTGQWGKIYRTVNFQNIEILRLDIRRKKTTLSGGFDGAFCEIIIDGTTVLQINYGSGAVYDTGWNIYDIDVSQFEGNNQLELKLTGPTLGYSPEGPQTVYFYVDNITCYTKSKTNTPIIWNTVDPLNKLTIGRHILDGAIHRINFNDSSTIQFSDDFTTTKYKHCDTTSANIIFDNSNSKIDINSDGYLYYKIDCYYDIVGTPILTSQINITSGTPTIQISIDELIWYDIDASIINDIETPYSLINTSSLNLDSDIVFYFRINCDSSSSCELKSFILDVDIWSTASKDLPLFHNTINTFQCDQLANSSIDCTIDIEVDESILQPVSIF